MINIPLDKVPNQIFTIVLEEVSYGLSLKVANNSLVASVKKNGALVMDGIRPAPYTFLMPYPYQYYNEGNFLFYTPNDEYPDYTKFGITQFLIYYTKDDVKQMQTYNYTYLVG